MSLVSAPTVTQILTGMSSLRCLDPLDLSTTDRTPILPPTASHPWPQIAFTALAAGAVLAGVYGLLQTPRPPAAVLHAAGAAPALIDCAAAAGNFFNQIRVNASLLAGAALGALWVDVGQHAGCKKSQLCQRFYSLLCVLTVCSELICIFVATSSAVRILHGRMDPLAPDTVTWLVREMELPYVTARVCFFQGLLTLIGALCLHAWAKFSKYSARLAHACMLLWAALAATLVGYMNLTTAPYANIAAMFGRFVYLFVVSLGQTVSGVVAIVSILGAVVLYVQSVLEPPVCALPAKEAAQG